MRDEDMTWLQETVGRGEGALNLLRQILMWQTTILFVSLWDALCAPSLPMQVLELHCEHKHNCCTILLCMTQSNHYYSNRLQTHSNSTEVFEEWKYLDLLYHWTTWESWHYIWGRQVFSGRHYCSHNPKNQYLSTSKGHHRRLQRWVFLITTNINTEAYNIALSNAIQSSISPPCMHEALCEHI